MSILARSLRSLCTLALLALPLALPTVSQAAFVDAFLGASGPGLDTMSFNDLGTPTPFDDNAVGTSPNFIRVNQKAYDQVDYIDMVFSVIDDGIGTTEYNVVEGVFNGTGIPWTDYHLELGFGVGAGFVISPAGDGLDFDAPDFDSPTAFAPFTSVTFGEDTIDAIGGVFVPGGFHEFEFNIDVPDGVSEFTIRQYPTIATPEPGAWALLASGCALALRRSGRRS
ncbi:MAG: hypothetical protein QNK05_08275 [Myxococcota bacterium]|nr:hypothetical protein [Myxococcota bacterium]